jgi:hypothetical protein
MRWVTWRSISTRPWSQERAAILEALVKVSDPDSPQYGQHLTQSQAGRCRLNR